MTPCPFCSQDLLADIEPAKPSQLIGCHGCANILQVRWEDETLHVTHLEGIDTIGQMAPAGSVMAGVFKILDRVVSEMPVPPEIPQRMLSLLHDPLTSMSDLANIINEDAMISMKVLKMANSAYYASTHEITDLQNACARLGMKTIGNIAHTVSNNNLYKSSEPKFRGIMNQLWQHGIATAHCAEQISVHTPSIDPAMPFVAGLIHDTGKLVLLDTLTTKYRGNIGRLRESPQLMVRVLNRFYPHVGLHVVQFWKMPVEFGYSTFFNFRPEKTPESLWTPLTHLVALASALADSCGFGVGDADPPDIAGHPSATTLGISDDQLVALHNQLAEPLDSMVTILSVA